jgi:hypothetical protein
MKRKSILMTIVALLFAGIAFGQLPALPGDGSVVGRDTIFFCARTDSLYPIELGYDVAGKRLHPSYGDWSLIGKTSSGLAAAEYDLGVPNGNGGAGNAYKVVGSGIGGYLFQYTSTDAQCNLAVGEKFWVYVFILPDYQDVIGGKDSVICVVTPTVPRSYPQSGAINLDVIFKKYIDLYIAAGFTFPTNKWTNPKGAKKGEYGTLDIDSVATYVFNDTLVFASKPAAYLCGDSIPFKLKITVDTIGQLYPLSVGICPPDTLGDLGARDPNEIFERNFGGSYNPSTIANGTAWTPKGLAFWKAYDYTYTDCYGSAKHVFDTLYLLHWVGSWGIDTVTYCRDSASLSIFTLYDDPQINYPAIGQAKPSLNNTNSYWYDRAVGGTYPPFGTISGLTSLNGYSVNLDDLKSNVGYHYLWRPDAAALPCLVNPSTGLPDSGYIVVILQDPVTTQDFRAQLCIDSWSVGDKFNVGEFTGITSGWASPIVTDATGSNLAITAPLLNKNTYTYSYHLAAGCGAGGDGVFYLRFTKGVKTPKSKKVEFCVNKLPASINLNEILGVAVKGLNWVSGQSLTTTDGFTASTGILNVITYVGVHGATAGTDLTFTVTGVDCGIPSTTTVTLSFVSDITL